MEKQKQSKQYLTFRLGEEQYGLEVLQVREVLEIPHITRVPRMPDFLKGVINIRGSVLSVIDLRLKLGLEEAEHTVHSRVIIIEIDYGTEHMPVGILVDSVQEVVDINDGDISPAPHIGTAVDSAFMDGIAKLDSNFVIIIKINHVFDADEIEHLTKVHTTHDSGLAPQDNTVSESVHS